MKYNWQQTDWTNFQYDLLEIQDMLYQYAEKIGLLSGSLLNASETIKIESIVYFMVAEAIKTSEIEGEYLSQKDVVSSIRNNLGLNKQPIHIKDARAQGIAQMLVDMHQTFGQSLTKQQLFNWHRMLLAANNDRITVGQWRTHKEPMQVVSGQYNKPIIHFEAPPSAKVSIEMNNFITWFNKTAPGQINEIKPAPLRAAIAHLYFESIHPFEDGNGRIGRAISEKVLFQALGNPIPISLSQAIEAKKKDYYAALEQAQKSNEITAWVRYFVHTILEAQIQAEKQIKFILKKAQFFDTFKEQMNQRQLKVVNRMLKEGDAGFEGGMSAQKYIKIAKCSKATATRDLTNLVNKGIFKQLLGGGRATKYQLNI